MSDIVKIAQGDMAALKTLYETYKIPVYRLAFAMTGNRELAEDITQDTFLRIQEKAHMYHGSGSEAAWIYTIARNITYDILRKRKREVCEGEEVLLSVISQKTDPESGVCYYLDLIRELPERDAELVSLRILGDLSFREIGRILNRSAASCNRQYNRALQKLRRSLQL
ncbi:MAG: RNA polymerase sigma factor [Acetatifactor sp.]|nr:RNA polymerase sigma factor [Acetatifactor sp.]